MTRTLGVMAAIAALMVASAAAAQQYTMEQTLSDQAQGTTVAFEGIGSSIPTPGA